MPDVIDGAELLMAVLEANSVFMAAVSNCVYGPPGDIPAGISTPKRFVTFMRDGGPSNVDLPMSRETFSFHCYGETTGGATTVYRALHDALNRKGNQWLSITGGIGLLRKAVKESGPLDLPNPDTNWPRVICTYS